MFIIGIDVGNYDTKTQNTSTPTGYEGPFSEKPPIAGEYLAVNGKYYIPTKTRFNYEKDKTQSERCIILSLFAIAKEIFYRASSTKKDLSHENIQKLIKNTQEIGIGVGLPPAHYTSVRLTSLIEYYRKYLGKGLKFEWNDYQFDIVMKTCKVYPQGAAGAIDPENTYRKDFPTYFVVDIGGYTVDVLKYVNDQLDGNWSSKEEGIITMYDDIIDKTMVNYDMTLDGSLLEDVLMNRKNVIPDDVVKFIKDKTKQHADNIVDLVRQLGVEFKAYPTLFLGGGSLLLEPYILQNKIINPKAVLFLSDPCANAKGYAKFLQHEVTGK